MPSEYRPRLSVDISEDHKAKLDKFLPDYGRKKELVSVILDDLFRLFEKHGSAVVIGAFIERAITLKEVNKLKLGD